MAGRIAQFIQFIPLFKKIFGDDVQAGQGRPASSGQTMTRQQAADFLGVEINASEQEIRAAHKRLMQKIHPDRGGSDALAKQINQARDLLLK
ncbi:MAG: DnaJ domain-containing protein [Gammaproteobacteria bacterium]|nr:DnaJ domain-containing protein [Gammaproteobacteria bacterium]